MKNSLAFSIEEERFRVSIGHGRYFDVCGPDILFCGISPSPRGSFPLRLGGFLLRQGYEGQAGVAFFALWAKNGGRYWTRTNDLYNVNVAF